MYGRKIQDSHNKILRNNNVLHAPVTRQNQYRKALGSIIAPSVKVFQPFLKHRFRNPAMSARYVPIQFRRRGVRIGRFHIQVAPFHIGHAK